MKALKRVHLGECIYILESTKKQERNLFITYFYNNNIITI